MKKKYVQFGCGYSSPDEWINFDYSPAIWIQKIPIIGKFLSFFLKVQYPENVKYGNIVNGLPLKEASCKAVFSSHTLEHLPLEEFRKALKNTYHILQNNGVFRCIVPDLEYLARNYVISLDNGNENASVTFLEKSLLGVKKEPKGFKKRFFSAFYLGMSQHLWMWDRKSLKYELEKVGFKNVRQCKFNDSNEKMFELVENIERFENSIAIECVK